MWGSTLLQRFGAQPTTDQGNAEQLAASEQGFIERVQQKVRGHDRYQLEFKLDYELLAGQQTRYQIHTYIFLPQNLGISQNSYVQNEFYRDLQNYIRLKTPVFTLRDLTRLPASPLVQIQKLLDNTAAPITPQIAERLITDFKFLRAVLKSALRSHFREYGIVTTRGQRTAPDQAKPQQLQLAVEDLLTETAQVLTRYRALAPRLAGANVEPTVLLAYRLTDESISLLVEERFLKAFQLVEQGIRDQAIRQDLRQKLRCAIEQETQRRLTYSSGSVVQAENDEEFLFRSSVLKKFTSSVLYLAIAVQQEGKTLEHLLYAFAAGISMIFATVVAFYAQRQYGMFTLPVFVALVVGYMFKDRIKELGRALFANQLRRYLFDRRILIRSQDGKHRLGYLREKMRFVSESAVPAAVMAARNREFFTDLANDGQGENVICYTKEVTLFKDVFQRTYGGTPPITGVNDIMRYDVRPYLRKMDDPVRRCLYLAGDQLRTVACHKVYHVNFISLYQVTKPLQALTLTRIRVVLDRKGIKRVEPLNVENKSTQAAPAQPVAGLKRLI